MGEDDPSEHEEIPEGAGVPVEALDEKEEGECSDEDDEMEKTDAEDGECSESDEEGECDKTWTAAVGESVGTIVPRPSNVFNGKGHVEGGSSRRESVIRFAAEGSSEGGRELAPASLEGLPTGVQLPMTGPSTSGVNMGTLGDNRKLAVRLVDVGNQVGQRKSWICQLCSKIFVSPELMLQHLKAHGRRSDEEVERPVQKRVKAIKQCNICGQVLGRDGNLENHMRLHSLKRPHACRLCGFRFSRRDTLKRHIGRMHTEVGEAELKILLDGSRD